MRAGRVLRVVCVAAALVLGVGCGDESHDNNAPQANNTLGATNNTTGAQVASPTLTILSPSNGSQVGCETCEVRVGWADGALTGLSYRLDAGAWQEVGGPFAGGEHVVSVVVPEGLHTIGVRARFEGGQELIEDVAVARPESREAVLVWEAPAAGAQTDAARVVVRGVVVADGEVSSVSVQVGDAAAEAATLTVEDGSARFEAEVALSDGENTLSVTATLADGQEIVQTRNITRVADTTAPTLELALPVSGHDVRGTQAFVRVQASDNVAVTEVFVQVDGADPQSLVSEGGWFTGALALVPGENSYTLVARDAAGNEATLEQTMYQGHRTASGGAHGGLLLDGALYVWGRNNKGQVGLGYTSTISDETDGAHPTTPQAIALTGAQVVSLAFTQNVSVALDDQGSVWTWGDGGDGQLGHGTPATDDALVDDDVLVPTKVAGLSDVVMIARGFDHTMALDAQGNVWAWGDNVDGQLGDGTTDDRDVPAQVPGLPQIVSIIGASATSYAIDVNGEVWAWGENTYGNLGNGTSDGDAHPTPAKIAGLSGVVDLACGRDHVVALDKTGVIYTWGLNGTAQAGPGEDHVLSPLRRDDVTGAVAVYAGGNQSFIEDAEGRVYGWGQNFSGNLGLIEDGNMVAPTQPVFGVEGAVSVGIGALQGLALRADGRAFSWGWSFEGSLGGGEGVINRWGYRVPILIALPEGG